MTFPLEKRDALPSLFNPVPCSPLLRFNGGGERDRTDDLLRAKQVLSQLSYTPRKATLLLLANSEWLFANRNWPLGNSGGPSWS